MNLGRVLCLQRINKLPHLVFEELELTGGETIGLAHPDVKSEELGVDLLHRINLLREELVHQLLHLLDLGIACVRLRLHLGEERCNGVLDVQHFFFEVTEEVLTASIKIAAELLVSTLHGRCVGAELAGHDFETLIHLIFHVILDALKFFLEDADRLVYFFLAELYAVLHLVNAQIQLSRHLCHILLLTFNCIFYFTVDIFVSLLVLAERVADALDLGVLIHVPVLQIVQLFLNVMLHLGDTIVVCVMPFVHISEAVNCITSEASTPLV